MVLAIHLPAQTNVPIRLAIISESPETAAAADVLTAEFSKDASLHLLERAEIEKVLREQKMSLKNLDRLKLGQLLGADGLLALQFVREGTNEFLSSQLVAVKPGVLLTSGRFKWPPPDVAAWSLGEAKHLAPWLPKLDVLAQEAIPFSVVNLHSAVETTAAHEMEQQLTFLIIERLTREKRLFVLERKRMQMLSEEKERSGLEDQPFWSGSYLLDGTIDRNGYSPDFVTVSARMKSRRREARPILIETSGSRTNYGEVINQLADKVVAALNINPTPVAWNRGMTKPPGSTGRSKVESRPGAFIRKPGLRRQRRGLWENGIRMPSIWWCGISCLHPMAASFIFHHGKSLTRKKLMSHSTP